MQYNIKWLDRSYQQKIMDFSKKIYETPQSTYSPNLQPHEPIWERYFVDPNTINVNNRRILGVLDENDELVMCVGVNSLPARPMWLLSWLLSDRNIGYGFFKLFRQVMQFLCDFYESYNVYEFMVVHPADKEKVYRKVMFFLREKYWTFTEVTVPRYRKPAYTDHWNFMGRVLYPYDVSIRRYIKIRE